MSQGRKTPAASRSLALWSLVGLLSVVFVLFAGPFFRPGLDGGVTLVSRRAGAPDAAEHYANLSRRVDEQTYSAAVAKGRRLYCLMGMSQAEAQAANRGVSLEAPEYLQDDLVSEIEGWSRVDDGQVPYFKNYLDGAFAGLGIRKNIVSQSWVNDNRGYVYADPTDPDVDEVPTPNGEITEAQFYNSFIVADGVVIADRNLNVNNAMQRRLGSGWKDFGYTVTHIQQWSDAAWMQWSDACQFHDGDVSNVRYIFRSWITNRVTQGLVFQALRNSFPGAAPTIGTWGSRLTLTQAEHGDAFYAVLGSPNGAGSAYFLLTHKSKLGVKTIDKVDVFVPNVPFTVSSASGSAAADAAKITLLFHVA
ncbi:hypothetical protein VTK73DRAFT_2641 [Phialemonium thermophilum]|uniref:Uncharacterized protein n=1 Tax=Phialemonium thermophilum TaxID=223376 RepID=A0ABR3VQP2_9PEZI